MERYVATQFYRADSPESRILRESGMVPSEFVLAADAQATVEALQRERDEANLYRDQARANQESLAACVDRDVRKIKDLQAALDAERERYELLNVERNAIDDKRHVLHEQLANTIEAAAQQEGELAEIQALAANLESQLSQIQAVVRALPNIEGEIVVSESLVMAEEPDMCSDMSDKREAEAYAALLRYRATLPATPTCEKYIASMCAERRPPKMTIPLQHYDEDFYIYTTLADSQATIAALQARVQELEQWVQDQSTANLETMRHTDEMQSRAIEAESQLTQRTAELEALRKWRDNVTVALQRPGGAFFEDVPKHIIDLVAELERVRDQFADLRKMVAALPKVEGEIYEAVASYRYDKAPEAWFHCESQLIALLQYRQGMEG